MRNAGSLIRSRRQENLSSTAEQHEANELEQSRESGKCADSRPRLVRLGENMPKRVKVPLMRSFPHETESNCVTARSGGEQLEVNGQSID